MVEKQHRDALRRRLMALERALDRGEECFEELRAEMTRRAQEVDEKFARAQEVLRSIGRGRQESG